MLLMLSTFRQLNFWSIFFVMNNVEHNALYRNIPILPYNNRLHALVGRL